MDNNDAKFNLSLNNYISDEYSICREERQYALFLSNILRKYRTKELRQSEIAKRETNSHNKSKNVVEDIFKVCHIPLSAQILDVFYEAAFMRDIFTRNRRKGEMIRRIDIGRVDEDNIEKVVNDAILSYDYSITKDDYQFQEGEQDIELKFTSFNRKLINFLQGIDINMYIDSNKYKEINNDKKIMGGKDERIAEKNLGHHMEIYENWLIELYKKEPDADTYKTELDEDSKKRVKMAKYMMNSKPDIAVIYKDDGKVYLQFLECKFESKEKKFDYNITQTQIQTLIAKFICKEYGSYSYEENGVIKGDILKEKEAVEVDFTRMEQDTKESTKKNSHKVDSKLLKKKINIKDLIELNNSIFDIK